MRDTMSAIQQEEFGGPDVMKMVEVNRPEPLGTEVLIRVRAAGVNPVDWKTRSGKGIPASLPLTVGWDVCGEVAAVGAGVTRFAVGDEVLGMPWFPRQAAGYAEYVTAPSRQVVRKPGRFGYAQAAGLPLAGLTAWQVLVETANTQPGQRVLVTAAAGGVGHLAVQIAKARGAYVLGTAKSARHDFVQSLGADEVIDYTRVDPVEVVSDLDVVFDPVGSLETANIVMKIRPGGVFIPFGIGSDQTVRARSVGRGIHVPSFLVEPDRMGLESLVGLVEDGQLFVEVDTILPLEQAAKAHQIGERGHTRGKIVLSV